MGKWKNHPHLAYLNKKLLEVTAGVIKRLMIFMPPQHGKSTITSHYFPAWYLGLFPDKRIILASYESEVASRWGRAVRNTLEEIGPTHFGIKIRQDSHAAHRWQIEGHSGIMTTAGVNGPITGWGADLFIVDDPVKDFKQAMSKTYQDDAINWFNSVSRTRMSENGSIVIMQTRWHEEDLSGKILKQSQDTKEDWHVINFPAIAEEDESFPGWSRKKGDALAPEMFSKEYLSNLEKQVGRYVWASLYQQRPTPEEGSDFKREFFKYWRGTPEEINNGEIILNAWDHIRFATVDLAASLKQEADYMVVASWCLRLKEKTSWELYLIDLVREHAGGHRIIPLIQNAIEKWKLNSAYIESTGMQLAIVQQMKNLGMKVREIKADKDKRARALSSIPFFEQGRVFFPINAPYLAILENEMLVFPRGDHDDMVDVIGYGCSVSDQIGAVNPFPPSLHTPEEETKTGIPNWMIKNQMKARTGKNNWRDEFESYIGESV